MKYLKLSLFLILMVLTLNGCKPKEEPVKEPDTKVPLSEMEHIGCQEGEIDAAGRCLPADKNNTKLFGRDLDPYVDTEEIKEEVIGFLARPKESGFYPGVVMIHEWWGLNDNVKEMAKILAKEGYIVFAVDLYNGEVVKDSTKARELATAVRQNPEQAVATMKQVVKYLKENHDVQKIASLGWCFGGQQSLNLSLNEKMDATVIYYGHLVEDKEQLAKISGPVLGIFGAEDTSITVESVKNFDTALNSLGIENSIHIYPNVGHAFANPSGSNYAPDETRDAWKKTTAFLKANLKGEVEQEAVAETKTFVITGINYKFLMNGQEAPELRVKKGTRVKIQFTSTEGFHDWVVDEFDAATERVQADNSTTVEFVADRIGTFEYYCSVGSHRANGMRGFLVVE